MCTIFLAWQCQPERPLVVLGNRDEFHHRPAAMASPINDTSVIGGKDLREGGMWMGINQLNSHFAAITNIRNLNAAGKMVPESPLSRGHIVLKFLQEKPKIEDFNLELAAHSAQFNGFNLIYGNQHQAWHFNNQSGRPPKQLMPGIYGLSNADLDSPWPKVTAGKQRFKQLLEQGAAPEALIKMMQNRDKAAEQNLPQTGLSKFLEKMLSSLFIRSPLYGTRCTTLIDSRCARLNLYEQRYQRNGGKIAEISCY